METEISITFLLNNKYINYSWYLKLMLELIWRGYIFFESILTNINVERSTYLLEIWLNQKRILEMSMF